MAHVSLDERISTKVSLAEGFECKLCLAEFTFVFHEKPYDRRLALFWHHQRDLAKLLFYADVRAVPLCVEADTFKRVPLLHAHIYAEFADDNVFGCDRLFVFRTLMSNVVCVDYLLFCNCADLIGPFS